LSSGDHSAEVEAFVQRIRAGDIRAGARAMRLADDRHPFATSLLTALYPHTGRARILGITGNPGSGKSTLTDQLVTHYRGLGMKVGVVAVDPSSPFSGGAILGDRIRMNQHATDPGVFIRSMATRGHLGGLSSSTHDVVSILDAMGYDIILLETVGVGQDEIEVVRVAHTSVVVLVPGLGDDIQAIKAGLLEIADIFVVNKADHEGVDRTVKDLRMLQMLGAASSEWDVPILRTVAVRGTGVTELVEAVAAHAARPTNHPDVAQRQRQREAHILKTMLLDSLGEAITQAMGDPTELLEALVERRTDPYTEAQRLMTAILRGEG
jgi:LAO/AO transport system kinase